MVLLETTNVEDPFQQNLLCCNCFRRSKLQECQTTFLAGQTAMLRYLCDFSSGPCFRPGHTPTDGAEGRLDSQKHLGGCLELRRSCVLQIGAIALIFSEHDKATVDAGIPASKS